MRDRCERLQKLTIWGRCDFITPHYPDSAGNGFVTLESARSSRKEIVLIMLDDLCIAQLPTRSSCQPITTDGFALLTKQLSESPGQIVVGTLSFQVSVDRVYGC